MTLSKKQNAALRLVAQTTPFQAQGWILYHALGIAVQTKNSLVRAGLLKERAATYKDVARWVQLTVAGREYAIAQGWIAE